MNEDDGSPALIARGLMRSAAKASLSTALGEGRWPYGSLVLVACDHDASPILLLSGLAEHTRNIAADPRLSLLFDGTAGLEAPLSGARLTVLGRAARSADERHRARYLARHPEAADYAGLADFAFYRVAVERAHLVAGFGRIEWIESAALLFNDSRAGALKGQEEAIVAHMNEDHADALDLYANVLLGTQGEGWTMTGCDPEGCDLRRAGALARLDFEEPVRDAAGARAALVDLVDRARAREA